MDTQKFIDQYFDWLRNETKFTQIDDYYEITTPFFDPDNDSIQIYVKQHGNHIELSDDGYTLNSLLSRGFTLSKKRKEQIQTIVNQFGIQFDEKEVELISFADEKDFPQKKHMLIQAILRVSDMYLTTRSNVLSLFTEDISSFFNENGIFYSDNIQLIGKSGFSHNYDFLLQRSRTKPERLCMAMNTPSRQNMSNILFSWDDTRQVRKEDTQLIVFINDENNIPDGIENGFLNYGAKIIRWKDRDSEHNINLLSA